MKRPIAFLLAVVLIAGLVGCGKKNIEEDSEANDEQENAEPKTAVELTLEKAGGYIYGVCWPTEYYKRLKDVGLGWVRFDIPYPYDTNGNLRAEYTAFKKKAKGYTDNKIKVMAITPYPKDFVNIGGFDPIDSANIQRTQEIAVFLINDLRNVVAGIQISNELDHPTHKKPFTTLEQAVKFIGIQAEALNAVKGDLIVGYNTCSLNKNMNTLMKPYLPYMDYVGVDLYYGTWAKGKLDNYIQDLRTLYQAVNKPILLAEFGYASKGSPTAEDCAAILAGYGYDSEAAARADIVKLVEKLPDQFKALIKNNYPDTADWGNAVFVTYGNHFYGCNKLASSNPITDIDLTEPDISHSEEGQAEFFRQLIPLLKQQPYLIGFFIYCWSDRSVCGTCGLERCPNETSWGLVTAQDIKKPSYHAVKEAIEACKATDAAE